ncbi:MAG TPA: hypothetical protein VN408_30340 [Actinoplanes sp.]|nr:hypothetical protein [Actinoplanes sp.]
MTGYSFTNIAEDDAHVAQQIGVLHVDGDYVIRPETSPQELFDIGARYLDARIPEEARRLIEEAVARGLPLDEKVQFFRLVALLSGRTLHHLDGGDLDQLTAVCDSIRDLGPETPWTSGLRCVLHLVGGAVSSEPDLVVKEIEELPSRQQDLILNHLGVLRDGPMEDRMWQLAVDLARDTQMSADRNDRMWIFFQPQPAPPRIRPVRPMTVVPGDWLKLVAGAATFLGAIGWAGLLLWKHGAVMPILAYLVLLLSIAVFVVHGAEWYSRIRRVRDKDAEFHTPQRESPGAADGFARRVDRLFDDYFGRYVPHDTERYVWTSQTAGLRQVLRDELVEIYRDQRINGDQIAWLIRHLVSEVRRGWENGQLWAYRERLRTPAPVKARCISGLAVAAVATIGVVPAVVRMSPLAGAACTVLALVSAGLATAGGFRITAERRRVQADTVEHLAASSRREQAFTRWTGKLALRPSDAEMAGWLESDRRILVDEVMRRYRLPASQVIAHAFIEAPGPSAKRARIHRGPWRYSRYQMLLFLLTDDGVRQVNVDLDFEKATSQSTQRLTYRFDTVASVRIAGPPGQRQTFELTLFNGPPVQVKVIDPGGLDVAGGEDAWAFSRVALDASGLSRTLEVMEGIAAEGKQWIKRRHGRAEERLTALTSRLRKFFT